MKRMKPLTRNREEVEAGFSRAFCATLPSEGEVSAGAKAFCATLPGAPEPRELAKAFCATLPSEGRIREGIGGTVGKVLEQGEEE